jgi:hypothetical protein
VVLPPIDAAKVRRLARGAPILVVCDCDQRRVMPGRVVELPRDTTPGRLREEVIAAAGMTPRRHAGLKPGEQRTARHPRSVPPTIFVYVAEGELKTDHRFYLAGQRFLTLHYEIERLAVATHSDVADEPGGW